MLKDRIFSTRGVRYALLVYFAVVVMLSIPSPIVGQSATQLLREGSRYQAADDTTDRAADIYRQLIKKYPKTAEAESAQFFLGHYYFRKFFILEKRDKVEDWEMMNRAEEELYEYKRQYPRGFYLADTDHVLAIIALRRGYTDKARSLYWEMGEAAAKDDRVYVFRFTWSPDANDIIKGYCKTDSLANASSDALAKQTSFEGVVNALTEWARRNCH